MALINIDDLAAGMRVGEAVKDRSGRLVIGAATQLTAKHLRILKMWGITQVDVDAESEEKYASRTIDPARLDQIEQEVRQLFSHTDLEDPVIGGLYTVIVKRRVRHELTRSDGD